MTVAMVQVKIQQGQVPSAVSVSPQRKPMRRSQEARSSETRARLMDAALEILHQRGYARATTADIADLAGVSRGALNHHFESKDELVTASVDRLLRRATDEIAGLAGEVRAGTLGLDAFLDKLWGMFSGQLFLVTLEHVTEARHNPWLREHLVPLVKDFHVALDAIWRTFFEGSGLASVEVETTLNATLCQLRGMGVQTVLRHDPPYFDAMLSMLKRDLAGTIAIAGGPP
jgi:AcrR family transcriptional regulator